jgi:aminoglycoside phosphotransferase (APT) family kinase protein
VTDLAGELRALLGGQAEITDLRRLTGGASRETWSFDADGRPLILRRPAPPVEAQALRAARRAGVPEPEILVATDELIIMERLEGETLARRILRDDAFAEVRPRLAEQCGEILARIHSIPVDEVPGAEWWDVLAWPREMIQTCEDPSPALELGLRWLEERRPPRGEDVIVHGDFRNGNLVIGPEGIRGVLDWEQVHRGDPMQDLGYLCVRAWRFGVDQPVGGFGGYEDLFRGYERVSGRPVDRESVRWWEVYGTVWWGAGCLRQAWRHLSGDEPSLELAAIGRRVHEQEYDTLLLLS